jgi:hypothetical protein
MIPPKTIPPKRRSDDGQAILKTALEGWRLRSDLGKLVELRGFEPPDLLHAIPGGTVWMCRRGSVTRRSSRVLSLAAPGSV